MDQKLLDAARSGKLPVFKNLANDPKRSIYDETTPEGNTVLHMAARSGRIELVKEIVKNRSSLVLKSNLKGETPVHIAARAGQHEVVKCFIETLKKFSGVYIARIRDDYGNTPLHGAVRNGHADVVKQLADGDEESLVLINDAGESPLSIAIDMRFTRIAKMIIDSHESTLDFIGHNGQTALHHAVLWHDPDTMALILSKKDLGNLVIVQDEKKKTPLHYAAALGHQTIVEKLLKADSSVAYIGDNNQQRPVHLAAKNGQISVIKTLLDTCPDTIEIVDNKQRNVLHLAAKNGNLAVVSHVLKLPEMEDLVNSPDVDGNTPLHLATSNYYSDVVAVLSKNPKVEIRAINNDNKTALAIVKLQDNRGLELQKHLTLKVLKRAYKRKGFDPEDILENSQLDDVDIENAVKDGRKKGRGDVEVEKADKDGSKKGREMAKIISVMSTLIATFTFNAAFTIPRDSQKDGTASILSKPAFRAFVISDTIAMISSIISAVIVFWSMSRRDTESFMDFLAISIGLTWISLIAMAVAFMTGIYAAVQKTLWLALLVCAIVGLAALFAYLCPILFLKRSSKSQTSFINRRDDNPFLFIVQLAKIKLS